MIIDDRVHRGPKPHAVIYSGPCSPSSGPFDAGRWGKDTYGIMGMRQAIANPRGRRNVWLAHPPALGSVLSPHVWLFARHCRVLPAQRGPMDKALPKLCAVHPVHRRSLSADPKIPGQRDFVEFIALTRRVAEATGVDPAAIEPDEKLKARALPPSSHGATAQAGRLRLE